MLMHLVCFAVIWVGVSPIAVWMAVGLYFIRMFAITGFFHRYFSHKTFSTSRAFQFVMAVWGATSVQRGALWWAGTHRHHHLHSDEAEDKHSPVVDGFWWSHVGWITAKKTSRPTTPESRTWQNTRNWSSSTASTPSCRP